MKPTVFGIAHILYLIAAIIVLGLLIFVSIKYFKSEKEKTKLIKITALILLISIIFSRISDAAAYGIQYIIPCSFCGMTSLLFSLFTLFGKKDNIVYHCLWYLGIAGGCATLSYPDFITEGSTIFYPPTFASLLHHTFSIYLGCELIIFKWFTPSLDKTYIFTLGVAIYIVFGYLDQSILKVDSSMCINEPLLSGTSINCYFILGVGSILVIAFNILLNFIRKKKNKI